MLVKTYQIDAKTKEKIIKKYFLEKNFLAVTR